MTVNLEGFIAESEHAARNTMLYLGDVPYDISVLVAGSREIIHLPAYEFFAVGAMGYGTAAAMATAGIGFAAREGTDILAISLLAPGQMEQEAIDRETGETVSSRDAEAFVIIAIDVSDPGHRRSLVVSYEVTRNGGSADFFNRDIHLIEDGSETSSAVCPPLDAFLAGVKLYKELSDKLH